MAVDKLKMARDAYGAFASGDVAGFLKIFAPATALVEADCLPYGGRHVGAADVGKALGAIGAAWKDISFDLLELVAGDKIVVAYGTFEAVSRATGKRINMPLAEVWEFDGDALMSITPLYFDTAAAAAALA